MNYKVNKWVFLAMSIVGTIILVMTFFIEIRSINQILLLIMAVGYGFVSGMAFMGDTD